MQWLQNRKIQPLSLVLLIALGISLYLNWTLFQRSRFFDRMFNATRIDPLGFTLYPPDLPRRQQTTPCILFLGDSRSAEWPFPAVTEPVTFLNRGIPGHTSTQTRLRFNDHVTPLQPDIVVIQVGINDLIGLPLFTPTTRQAIIEATSRNITELVIRSRSRGATVILTTIFPPGEIPFSSRFPTSADISGAVVTINSQITALAGEGVLIMDTAAILAGSDGFVRPEFRRDAWHLNEAGYLALNQALTPLLQAVLHQ